MKVKYTKGILAVLVLASLTGGYVSAVDATEPQQLEEYVVTASRMKQKLTDVAADTQVITYQQIEQGNYNNVSDALKANNVQVVQNGPASYPILNGDSRVLVMVNGRKMNWDHLVVAGAQNAVDIDKISMDNVERIEVVKGPNSSLYGERAVAGVINIITKQPDEGLRFKVGAEYGSFAHRKGTFGVEGGNVDTQFELNVTKELRNDYEYAKKNGGSQKFQSSDIDRLYVTGRLDQRVNKEDRLTFDLATSRKDDGYGLKINNYNSGAAYGSGNKQKDTDWSYGLTYTFGADTDGEGTYVRAYRNTEKSETVFGTAGSDYSHDLAYTVIEGQKVFKLSKDNTLTAGVSYANEKIKESNDRIAFDKTLKTKAIYAEDRHEFKNGWSLNSGLRWENQSHIGSDIAGHIGINKKLSDKTHMYLSWGQAVNNPSLKMLYANTIWWYGNPSLRQEKSHTVTFGVDSEVNRKLTVSASAYHSWLKDALAWQSASGRNPLPTQGNYINVDREKRAGISLSGTYKINDAWSARLGFSYTNVKKQSSSANGYLKDTENTYPQEYSLDLMYKEGKWSVDTMFNFVKGRSYKSFNYSSYATLDMNVNYQVNKATKVYLKGYNLLDRAYEVEKFDSFGRVPMPERHFVGGVEYKF